MCVCWLRVALTVIAGPLSPHVAAPVGRRPSARVSCTCPPAPQRSQREKDASGLADIPGGAKGKLLEVEYAFTEDRKLRGQLRDPSAIEAQVTALQIAALKRIGRGTKVLLLDRFGNTSKAVARELARRGFGRTYVITGGFDGRSGWVQSKLLVKPTATQYVSSSPLPSVLARTLSTRTESTRGRKALPAPSK